MQNPSIFSLSNVECSYNQKDIIVRIDSLELPANTITFIVGPSGVGKSTLLETLGLMNNTIHNPTTASIKYSGEKNVIIDFASIWNERDNYISGLRSRNFSFIFQETNLMPELTAGQNLCMKMLIQGKRIEEAKEYAIPFMSEINLDAHLFDRRVQELSGGQRQRLAFLRGFLGESKVLFCDEPTGNLDTITAESLMTVLNNHVKEKERATAIIVSHDLTLAARYADLIVPIVPQPNENPDKKTGVIRMEQVLIRHGRNWNYGHGSSDDNIHQYLTKLYSSAIPSIN